MKPILLCAVILTLTGCANQPVAEPLRRYELHGQIQRLDTQGKVPIATIKHEAIGDWMGAMTMDFPVKDPADLSKLKQGAPVNATVFVQGFDYWVGEVKDAPTVTSK